LWALMSDHYEENNVWNAVSSDASNYLPFRIANSPDGSSDVFIYFQPRSQGSLIFELPATDSMTNDGSYKDLSSVTRSFLILKSPFRRNLAVKSCCEISTS
jgi:hypothetical protein